jgi:peroxiredoxin
MRRADGLFALEVLMKKTWHAIFPAALFLVALACAQAPQVPAPSVGIGGKLPAIQLATVTGTSVDLAHYAGKNGLVVIFVSTRCPYSNDYEPRMEELSRLALQRGFGFLGVNANRTEPAEEVVEHSKTDHLTFTILKDEGNRLADILGASFTPESYVFDQTGTLRYHGRIDDSRNAANVTTHDLQTALDLLVAGKPISATETKAFGCTIKRVPRAGGSSGN